jgi:hypothetical protein
MNTRFFKWSNYPDGTTVGAIERYKALDRAVSRRDPIPDLVTGSN